jgi:hypothetical protein
MASPAVLAKCLSADQVPRRAAATAIRSPLMSQRLRLYSLLPEGHRSMDGLTAFLGSFLPHYCVARVSDSLTVYVSFSVSLCDGRTISGNSHFVPSPLLVQSMETFQVLRGGPLVLSLPTMP